MNLDRRSFLAGLAALGLPTRPRLAIPPHPHAALWVYTERAVRERHVPVVKAALERRAAAHTSGWRSVGGKPDRDRKSTRLNSSHQSVSRMPSSA